MHLRLLKVFPPKKKLTRQDVPESFACSPGSFTRRRQEGILWHAGQCRAPASLFPVMCLSACRSVHFLSSSCCRVTEWQIILFSSLKYVCRICAQPNNLNCTSIVYLRVFFYIQIGGRSLSELRVGLQHCSAPHCTLMLLIITSPCSKNELERELIY